MATDIRIKYSIDTEDILKAQVAFDKLTAEEADALAKLKLFNKELEDTGDAGSFTSLQAQADKLRASISKLSPASEQFKKQAKEFQKVTAELNKVERAAFSAGKKIKDAGDSAGGGIGGLMGKLGPLGPAIAGAFSIGAVVSFGKATLDTAGRFETLGAVLKTTLGSDSAALGAMIRIKEIASTTPFSVEELTASFVKLANQGFKPTNQQIIALGDLASSTGKSFDMLAEALIDAQVGEFERLKEFGVRASKAGDQVTFTFKGQQTVVQNTSAEIQKYLVSLGSIEGVAGSMAAISATTEGAVSNLGDAWDGFLASIGEGLAPVYKAALKVTADFLNALKGVFQSEESKYLERQGKSYNIYAEQFKKNSTQALKNVEENSFQRLQILEKEVVETEKKYRAQQAKVATLESRMQDEKGRGFTYVERQREKEYENEFKRKKQEQADLKAQNQAAIDEIKTRLDVEKGAREDKKRKDKEAADAADKAAKKAEAALKKEYKDKEDAIKLNQKLQEEAIKQTVDPDGQAMARKELEMATNIELLALAKEHEYKKLEEAQDAAKLLPAIIATQNKEIADQYAADDKALKEQREKSLKELWTLMYETEMAAIDKQQSDATVKLLESGLSDKDLQKQLTENEIKFNQQRIELNDSYANLEVDAAQKGNDKLIEENARKNRELKKQDEEAAKERLEIFNAAVELGSQITNGFFEIYQQQLANEQTQLQKKYDEEVRLADGNKQKLDDINRKRAAEEKEIKRKQFEANRAQAIAEVVFNTAPLIAQYLAGVLTGPLAIIAFAAQAAQIAFITAQPVPEFAEGTKGKKFKGGRAIVGERGTERIVTQSGKVYYTPPTATLIDLPRGSEVIPNHLLSREEIAYASMSKGRVLDKPSNVEGKLSEIGAILKGLPIHQINMDERGFEKYIRTERRSTKVLNNKFPAAYS